MLTARTALSRRVTAALDASPSRIPVLLGGCGSGRTTMLQQVRERLLGNVLCDDRFAKSDKHGMRRIPGVARIQLALPPVQQFQRTAGVRNLIAKIVGPTAIGVEIVKMLVEFLGKKPTGNVEIFVVVRGDPVRVLLRGRRRTARRRDVFCYVEFAWAEHVRKADSSLRSE